MITATFQCPECQQVNEIKGFRTTDTGEWIVECMCGETEELDINVFPVQSNEKEAELV